MPFSVGTNVGPYRILEQLGQGGMATVYKAYHPSLDRYVAIKVLHQAFLEDANFQARFQREARLVARLEHPNIVPIYDYAEQDGQPYLVMKFIEGETLKARLQRGPLNATEVQEVVETVGQALAYAHRQGILHRDIKPSNVILAKDGNIYLADFGLARIAQSGESTLTSDMVLGTPQYISPEQAMAKKDLDEGTDIYSFGVMLYEMTVGRVPFSADTPFSVIHDHIYTPLPLPSSVNPKVSPHLERVLLKALAKERVDRYSDIPSLVEAFKQAWTESASTVALPLSDSTTLPPANSLPSAPLTMPAALGAISPSAPASAAQTPPPVPVTDTGSTQQRKKSRARWMWVAAGVGVCLCCGAAFFATRLNNRGNPEPPAPPSSLGATVVAAVPSDIAPTVEAAMATAMPPAEEEPIGSPVELRPMLVEAAKKALDEHPDSLPARVQYGYALVKDGQALEGYQQIRKVAELAAKGKDWPFLLGAAHALDKGEMPLGAAILYTQLSEAIKDNSKPVPGMQLMVNDFHRVVYHGFAEPIAPEVLDYGTLGKADEAVSLMAQARYAIFHRPDDPGLAQKLIDELRGMQPGWAEADLLQGELLIMQKKYDEAKPILERIKKLGDAPVWIKQFAGDLLAKKP